MKLQCSCGAKYSFDVTPEMAQNPVRFICPQCGADSSAFVNQLVRQELGLPPVEPTPAPAFTPPPGAVSPPPAEPAPASAPPAPTGSRLRISHEPKPAAAPVEEAHVSKFCSRHRGVPVTDKCTVCHKPICPQCMEMFGFFCSPLCKNKADLQGLAAPEYAGQRFNVEARFWRKTGLIFGGVVTAIVLFLGIWIWYAWVGSVAHPYFTVPFPDDPAYSGRAELVGPDQLVFLHGGTLARYSLKTKKPVWSQILVTPQQIDELTKAELAEEARANASRSGDEYHASPNPDQIQRSAKMSLQAALSLWISGRNVWVRTGNKLTHYDWDTGKILREVSLPDNAGELTRADGELLALGEQSVTHLNLTTGETHEESVSGAGGDVETPVPRDNAPAGGLPLAGSDNAQPMDPNTVANQAQNLKLPGRIALPALLGNAEHEQQLEAALNDNGQHQPVKNTPSAAPGAEYSGLIPDGTHFIRFSQKLLEKKIVSHTAMQAPPKKSALDGEVNASRTADVANEILNEMQRNRGGDTVEEDVSRYQVTVHLSDAAGAADWTGEVAGMPQLFPLATVNVIAAGKDLIVLDKSNKKLWQATLTYPVTAGEAEMFGQKPQYGQGPCVEHDHTLYIFDQAVLSAFDLATGNARWRLPSVGVVGLFFDDQGMVYVNTTTGNPDDVKYSRQIDITKVTQDVVMKVDARTGRTLWSVKPGGFISYLSGKFIYTVQTYDKNPTDEPVLNDSLVDLEKPSYFRIARINPHDGRVLWEYYDPKDRVPFYVHFDRNQIELVFKRQVQLLKYLTF